MHSLDSARKHRLQGRCCLNAGILSVILFSDRSLERVDVFLKVYKKVRSQLVLGEFCNQWFGLFRAKERAPFNRELTRHELGKETKWPILCSTPRKLGAKGVALLLRR